MARSIATIKEAIRVQKNLYSSISSILFKEEGGSGVGILNNIADVVAININILEQLEDAYRLELEEIAASAVPGTSAWIQAKLFEFQYDADAVVQPSIQLIDLVPTYNEVDEDLQIITRAAVSETGNGRIFIKVAASEPPVALDASQKTALETYLDIIIPAGPTLTVSSDDADKLFIDADVYYDGQFVESIQTDVEAAINAYLASLDFNGVVLVSKIQDAIQGVSGVKDVVINQVKARGDATPFVSATVVTRQWATVAGYIVEETETGKTFADTITYSAE
jgi:hypothetical protein